MSSLQDSVNSILDEMGIECVYHVDDYYCEAKPVTLDNVMAQFNDLNSETLKKILVEDFTGDSEIDQAALREKWEDLTSEEKEELSISIGESFIWDKKASELVESLFSEGRIEKLSPLEWEAKKEKIYEIIKGSKVLFLFDNDWGEHRKSSGIEAISSLLKNPEIIDTNLLCGLYTHTVTPEEEYSKRMSLATEKDIDNNRFLVISKQHEEETFVSSLRTTALIPTLIQFRDNVNKNIKDATTEVENIIAKLDIIDLEYITLDTSHKEGDWEPEILYRIHKNRHQKEFKSKLFADSSIQELIEKMRKIKFIDGPKIRPTREIIELMKHELYDEEVNRYNCPIKSGDIFEKGDKKYILLSQPCDLMIRSDGQRRPDGFNCFTNLVEIKAQESSEPSASSKLDYLDIASSLYVHFSKAHKVELAVLDLCTFNNTGETSIDLKVTSFNHKIAGLTKRYEEIYKKINKTYNTWILKTDGSSDVAKQLFTPNGKGVLNLTTDKTNKIINFGLKRIARLSKAKAQVILDEFLRHKGRPASEVDFTL